jgi:hypothetical protein
MIDHHSIQQWRREARIRAYYSQIRRASDKRRLSLRKRLSGLLVGRRSG